MEVFAKSIIRIILFTISQVSFNYIITLGIGWQIAQLFYEPRLGNPGEAWVDQLAMILAVSLFVIIITNALMEIPDLNNTKAKSIIALFTVAFLILLFTVVDDTFFTFPMRSIFSYLCVTTTFIFRVFVLEWIWDKVTAFDWRKLLEQPTESNSQ